MLTPKERLKTVLSGEKADRTPCICPGGMMNMITEELMKTVQIYLPQAHTDAEMMAGLAKAVYDQGCFENYGVPFCMTIEAEEMGAKVDLGSSEKGQTSRHEISFDDGYSLFKTKTATREQIAAKYLNTEITGMLAANTAKVEKTASMKM